MRKTTKIAQHVLVEAHCNNGYRGEVVTLFETTFSDGSNGYEITLFGTRREVDLVMEDLEKANAAFKALCAGVVQIV